MIALAKAPYLASEEVTRVAIATRPAHLVDRRLRAALAIDANTLSLLHSAAEGGALALIDELVTRRGLPVDLRDASSRTPLQVASESGTLGSLEALLSLGAKIDDQGNPARWSALHFAASAGQTRAASALLARGADSRLRDALGRTPADVAETSGRPQLADLLRQTGLAGAS